MNVDCPSKRMMLSRKQPRDFVHTDEFWPADDAWPHYFFQQKVWVYVDEYNPGVLGDEDYSRIIVHAGSGGGWIYSLPLELKPQVLEVLAAIKHPVAILQLECLGFIPWSEHFKHRA